MTIKMTEDRNCWESTDNPMMATGKWTLTGAVNEFAARAYARANTPLKYSNLWKQNLVMKSAGYQTWKIEVPYGPFIGKAPEEGDVRWTFDTTGGSAKITHAVAHIAGYVASGTAPDHGGTIGVNSDGDVEGCTIVVPARKWTETWLLSTVSASFAYGDTLEAMTGTTNSATFRGKAAGYVLFLGASAAGSIRNPDLVEVTYHFETGIALTSQAISGITVTSKLPHQYMWFEHKKEKDATAKRMVKKVHAIHVEQVYYSSDFSNLGIGTGIEPGL